MQALLGLTLLLVARPTAARKGARALGKFHGGIEADEAMATTSTVLTRVNPRARVLAIVGDPVGVTRSPIDFPAALAKVPASRDAVLVPLDVADGALGAVARGLLGARNFDGFIVTKPHKAAVVEHCTHLTSAARALGCANVVRVVDGATVVGTNLDGVGFVAGLVAEHGSDAVRGKRCVLVGAGGAARAIAHELLGAGAARVAVRNRTRRRAEALAAAVPGVEVLDALESAADFDILVQCTSLGHGAGDPDPVPHDLLVPPLLCCEVIHTPADTAFLLAAASRGCATHRGKFMLDAQIEAIARFLTTEVDTWPEGWAYAPK